MKKMRERSATERRGKGANIGKKTRWKDWGRRRRAKCPVNVWIRGGTKEWISKNWNHF